MNDNAWFAIEYALTIQNLKRLGWQRSSYEALTLLDVLAKARHETLADGDHAFARRLAFALWLRQTGRISEGVI
jgi:hypothetical protein